MQVLRYPVNAVAVVNEFYPVLRHDCGNLHCFNEEHDNCKSVREMIESEREREKSDM